MAQYRTMFRTEVSGIVRCHVSYFNLWVDDQSERHAVCISGVL